MTDAQIDVAVASDADWAVFEPIHWSKAQGPGYQRRINAVLRSYAKQRKMG
jgi:uncharacterized protein (DUF4415 family)